MAVTLFNPNLTAEGYSADNMLQLTREMGSNFALVRNSPKLISMMKSLGIKTIYREAGDDPQGNPLGQRWVDFVSKRISHAPNASLYHMTNEVGFSSDLDKFNQAAADQLEAYGRKGVFYNASTNQSLDQWIARRPIIMDLHLRGHEIGMHIYIDNFKDDQGNFSHDQGGLAPLELLLSWGITPLITEFAWIESIFGGEVGWKSALDDLGMNKWNEAIIQKYPILKKAPLFVFSADDWPSDENKKKKGFGFFDHSVVYKNYNYLNMTYKLGDAMPATIPARETLGTPISGMIVSVPKVYVNIRATPDANGEDIGDLHKGDTITYRPNPIIANGFTWYALEAPMVGWFTNLAKIGAASNQIPRISQNIPYISQEGTGSNKFRNDCGVASILMAERFCMVNAGFGIASIPTVDELSARSPLSQKDYYLTFNDLINLGKVSGFDFQTVQGMNLDKIAEFLRNGIAPIILVSYAAFNPNHGEFTHFCVPYAYNDQVFWVHDPYVGGETYQITHEQLDFALQDVARLGDQKYQGLVVSN